MLYNFSARNAIDTSSIQCMQIWSNALGNTDEMLLNSQTVTQKHAIEIFTQYMR